MGFVPFCLRVSIAIAIAIAASHAHGQTLLAGAAKAELPVAPGMPMDRPILAGATAATGVHDPVWVRALYLEQDDLSAMIVTLDVFRVTPVLRQRILALAPKEIPRENIVIAATLVSTGPGGASQGLAWRSASGAFTIEILDGLVHTAATAMQTAFEAKVRATIGVGAVNQDVLTRNAVIGDGPTDPLVGALRVDNADGIPIALVGRFSALPATNPKDAATLISSDFVGAYYTHLESLAAPGCVALFLNGASGDQESANPEHATGWEWPASVGRLWAIRVKEAANGIRGEELALAIRYATVPTPLAEPRAFIPALCTLHCLSIGPLALWFVPAMPTFSVARDIEAAVAAPGKDSRTWLVSGANGNLGVIAGLDELGRFESRAATPLIGLEGPAWLAGACAQVLLPPTAAENTQPVEPEPSAPEPFSATPLPSVIALELNGDGPARGVERGRLAAPYLATALVAARQQSFDALGVALRGGLWDWAPRAVDRTANLMPHVVVRLRAEAIGFPKSRQDEIAAYAAAANTTVDGLWLTERILLEKNEDAMPLILAVRNTSEDAASPLTVVVDGVAQAPLPLAITRTQTAEGVRVWTLGFVPQLGGFLAHSSEGVIAALSVEPDAPGGLALPVRVAGILETAKTAEGAGNQLLAMPGAGGATVLFSDKTSQPILLTGGETWVLANPPATSFALRRGRVVPVNAIEDTLSPTAIKVWRDGAPANDALEPPPPMTTGDAFPFAARYDTQHATWSLVVAGNRGLALVDNDTAKRDKQ